jgi:hypothetical protein
VVVVAAVVVVWPAVDVVVVVCPAVEVVGPCVVDVEAAPPGWAVGAAV